MNGEKLNNRLGLSARAKSSGKILLGSASRSDRLRRTGVGSVAEKTSHGGHLLSALGFVEIAADVALYG